MKAINNRAGLIHAYDANKKLHTFLPGANEIDKETWASIASVNASLVAAHFQVVAPVDDATGDTVVGADEINIAQLGVDEAVILVQNTMNVDELIEYLEQESSRSGKVKPRVTVTNAIGAQVKQIEDTTNKIEAEKKKAETPE